jgi:hypothetical protein
MKHNIKKHEHMGLLLVFFGATWLGFALYGTLLAANRMLVQNMPLIAGKELLIFPMFYGLGAILLVMGNIEIREMLPGKNR